ncbi:hypothetical protein RUND412_003772 [Rhizina undulata]
MFFPLLLLLPFAIASLPHKHCTISLPPGTTDASPLISKTFADCSYDATITFSKNTTYPIGSVLSLTSLNNVRIELYGTLKYSDDLKYWIRNGLYQEFQNVSIGMEIGGTNIEIDGGGTGVVDGQGQIWYDYTNGISQYFGRPIPFSLRRAHKVTAKNFSIINSQYWSFLISNSTNVTISGMTINVTSTTNDGNPGNVGNTDGFDTLWSDNVRILDSYVKNGDDCVAIKPNSTNIEIRGLTCERGSGIAIGSLGQYEGVYDWVENVTVSDIVFKNSRAGAWIKTWSGAKSSGVYPPNGGGNGTGLIKNILFENLKHKNISGVPVYITQCNTYSQYAVPCAEAPTSFKIENVVWDGVVVDGGDEDEAIVDLICLGVTGCNGIVVKGIEVSGRNYSGVEGWECQGVNGVKNGCGGL